MKKVVYGCCGIDVHKKMLKICIATRDVERIQTWECENTGDSIRLLVKHLKRYGVKEVAFESTGIYWQMLHDLLEPYFDVTVANARHIKAIPGKKTDTLDAKWIVTLLAKRLIKKSYVPSRDRRHLREICRMLSSMKSELTRYLNKQHKILDQWDVNLADKKNFSKIRSQTCQYAIKKLSESKNYDEAIAEAPKKRIANELKRKREKIEPYFTREFPELARVKLRVLCGLVETHLLEINRLKTSIRQLVQQIGLGEDITKASSIPGLGEDSAIELLAEIGPVSRYGDGRKLVSWSGLNPSVYQSAGTNLTGRITKQGNRHVRRILHNCAVACIKRKETALHDFYERIKKRRGGAKALVALMAKLLRTLHVILSTATVYRPYPSMTKNKPREAVS